MTPNVKGVCKVPDEVRQQWEDLSTREMICSLFEKCGNDPDRVYWNIFCCFLLPIQSTILRTLFDDLFISLIENYSGMP